MSAADPYPLGFTVSNAGDILDARASGRLAADKAHASPAPHPSASEPRRWTIGQTTHNHLFQVLKGGPLPGAIEAVEVVESSAFDAAVERAERWKAHARENQEKWSRAESFAHAMEKRVERAERDLVASRERTEYWHAKTMKAVDDACSWERLFTAAGDDKAQAEGHASRLREALEAIVSATREQHGLGYEYAKRIARAALNDEPQPVHGVDGGGERCDMCAGRGLATRGQPDDVGDCPQCEGAGIVPKAPAPSPVSSAGGASGSENPNGCQPASAVEGDGDARFVVSVAGGGTFTYDLTDVGRFAKAMAEQGDQRAFWITTAPASPSTERSGR